MRFFNRKARKAKAEVTNEWVARPGRLLPWPPLAGEYEPKFNQTCHDDGHFWLQRICNYPVCGRCGEQGSAQVMAERGWGDDE